MIKLVANFLLPPLNLLTLAALGLLLAPFRRRIGFGMAAFSIAGLVVLCTPLAAGALLAWIEIRELPDLQEIRGSQAIVILSGGTYRDAPEYGGDTAGSMTLERLRYGARLYRLTGLPLLVSGGNPLGNTTSEAQQMRTALMEDFKVPVRWIEAASDNTWESAFRCRELLATEKIDRVTLVTHASHMRRAKMIFEHAGFSALMAPTAFTRTPRAPWSLTPDSEGLRQSRIFFHEALGLGWYHLRIAAKRE